MTQFDHFILGQPDFHERFYMATAILGKLVSRGCTPLTSAELKVDRLCSAQRIDSVCKMLYRSGLIRKVQNGAGRRGWLLSREPSEISLEDVFKSLVHGKECKSLAAPSSRGMTDVDRNVELLVSQAAMGINALLFRHLREFSLLSLKTRTQSIFPAKFSTASFTQP